MNATRRALTCWLCLCMLLLCACAAPLESVQARTVLFEDNPDIVFTRQVYAVAPGDDLHATLRVASGLRIAEVSYANFSLALTESPDGMDAYALTLHQVRYSAVVRFTVLPARVTRYEAGRGTGDSITVEEDSPRLRVNTLPYAGQFRRAGYLPIGWNTAPDGTGTHIGFGSRADPAAGEALTLYPDWLVCSPEAAFTRVPTQGGVMVTGYSGTGNLVIPETLDGQPVVAVAPGAFGEMNVQIAAFPPSLTSLAPGAFRSFTADELYLFDGLTDLSDLSFGNCRVTRLHISALRDPVYCGSYFDTLTDKLDYLMSVAEKRKLILFGGSGVRFGFDSPMLEAAFPDYTVVNMGVYAYANMLPQARLILPFLRAGDLVLSSPELDAVDTQFCGHTALDRELFAMTESSYDLLTLLDMTEFTGVFDAFAAYQAARVSLPARAYADAPSGFDEDGKPRSTPAYNRCGDYVVHRENNVERRLFGVKRAYYNVSHILPEDWQGLNRIYDAFAMQGARVLFAYSPRSSPSVSTDSDADSMAVLDATLRATLHAEVISHLADSLMDPLYFYGTDNHLSSEGVTLHTRQIIADIQRAMEDTP